MVAWRAVTLKRLARLDAEQVTLEDAAAEGCSCAAGENQCNEARALGEPNGAHDWHALRTCMS